MIEESYERERIREVVRALDQLWYATDYRESRDTSLYTDEEMKRFLGEWIQVKKAGNEIFDKIRQSRPDLPGWNPMRQDVPLDQGLAEKDEKPESST